jgi:hypothetical protein
MRTLAKAAVAKIADAEASFRQPVQWQTRLAALPEIALRYFHFALPRGVAGLEPGLVRIQQRGWLRMSPGGRWFAIRATQHMASWHPGFVWHARLRLLPGVWIDACDSLTTERGRMDVRLWSLFRLAGETGPAITQSSQARWLMEGFWNPPMLLTPAIEWDAIDERRAQIQFTGVAEPVTARLEIDADGCIRRVSGLRYRSRGRGLPPELSQFSGTCEDWREVAGWRVPWSIEAGWDLPEGPFRFARFHLSSIER